MNTSASSPKTSSCSHGSSATTGSCASSRRRLGGLAGAPCCSITRRPRRCVDEVPDLVEFPGVVAGAFDPAFLSLPPEVLTTTLIHHQHFFPVADMNGALMPAFLAVTNTEVTNDRAIAVNAERVVTARLRDARFFWDADRKVGLEARLPRLETLLFHKKLGSYRQKTDRVEHLAGWLASEAFGAPGAADAARRAARLSKADLASEMVREFTELQGAMGGIYAREAGEPEAVWKAVYHHYLPLSVTAGGAPSLEALGEARVTWAALSLADKLDTVVGLFLAGERPTGSRDPFGLRRQAHGALRILVDAAHFTGGEARMPLGLLCSAARERYAGLDASDDAWPALEAFLRERLEHVLEQRGAAAGNVRAVSRHRPFDQLRPAELERNLVALADFSETDSFRKLAEAFKRVRNIARELDRPAASLGELRRVLTEPGEIALLDEIDARRAAIDNVAGGAGDFRAAYAAAAGFEPVVAKFFNEVFVMAEDAAVREARLGLMKQLEHVILQLSDISEIVGSES